jgi:hypothetical protein
VNEIETVAETALVVETKPETALLVAMTVAIAEVKTVTRVEAQTTGNVANISIVLKVKVKVLVRDDAQEMNAHDVIDMQRLKNCINVK